MGKFIGWAVGLALALAVVYGFDIENVIICALLGFSLSFAGMTIGNFIDESSGR